MVPMPVFPGVGTRSAASTLSDGDVARVYFLQVEGKTRVMER